MIAFPKKSTNKLYITYAFFVSFTFIMWGGSTSSVITLLSYIMVLLWILCSLYLYPDAFHQMLGKKQNVFLIIYLLYVFILIAFRSGISHANHWVGVNMLYLSPIFISVFYSQLKSESNTLTSFFLGIILFFCVRTILFAQNSVLGLRGDEENIVDSMVGGGYAMSFALCTLVPVLFYSLLHFKFKFRYTISIVLIIILFEITLIKSLYVTAMIFSFIGCFIAYLIGKSIKKKIIITALVLASIFINIKADVPNLLISALVSKEASGILTDRLFELSIALSGDDIGNTEDLSSRLMLYSTSFKTFFTHPILGVGYKYDFTEYSANLKHGIGYHSQWTDTLGLFGIFGSFFLFYLWKTGKYFIKNVGFKIAFIQLILFGLINTVWGFQSYFTVFYFAPRLFNLLKSFSSDNSSKLIK